MPGTNNEHSLAPTLVAGRDFFQQHHNTTPYSRSSQLSTWSFRQPVVYVFLFSKSPKDCISISVDMSTPSGQGTSAGDPQLYRDEDPQFYFAYGSNLHLVQMASRCPDSKFVGKSVLPGYRWQINQRGVANVVQSPDNSVEGLLYQISASDTISLDHSEGVAQRCYEKVQLEVDFEPHPKYHDLLTSEVAGFLDGGDTTKENQLSGESTAVGERCLQMKKKALVYVSLNFIEDGEIREEYIIRMHNAVRHAKMLGVSAEFIEKYVGKHLQEKASTSSDSKINPIARLLKENWTNKARVGPKPDSQGSNAL